MDTSKLCMYCMQENGGNDVCPHCGKDANAPLIAGHLKPGEIIGGRFVVGRAVGQDATGVVYMVYDTIKGNKLRIREYLPRGIAARDEDGVTLTAMPGMTEQYDEGLAEMLTRAESAEDPSRAMASFEENGTLYVVLRKKKAAAAPVPVEAEPAAEEAPEEERFDEDEEYDEEEDDYDDEEGEGFIGKIKQHMTAMIVGLFIVLLLIAAAIVIISRSSNDPTNNNQNNDSPLNNWVAPTETPLPTAGATDEFGNIIKPEQNWQNEAPGENLNNYGDPTNTPIPDDYEPDWLTQATDVPMVTDVPATDVPEETATPEPEPEATPRPTLPVELIDKHADEEVIALLQARLIELGWLDIDEPTGQLGKMTRSAIEDFQEYIHDNFDDAMGVDGYAGAQTVEWLNREDAPRNPEVYPTPEPTETPEPTATPVPTLPPETGDDQPDAEETPEPTDIPADLIDQAVIDEVQDRLAELGWLDESQCTGVYDNATTLALKDYQTYLNQMNPNAELPETGLPDENTLLWLRWDGAPMRPNVLPQATETPEPVETPEPEQIPFEVNAESPTEDIQWLQKKLHELQWLKMDVPTGVYDEFTVRAVTNVQMYINQRYTLTLTADGMCDNVTASYLASEYNAPVKPDSYELVDSTAVEVTQDPNEAPGAEGTAIPEPTETEIPVQPTDAPAETQIPAPPEAATDEPVTATDEPVVTDEPTATDVPGPTEAPVIARAQTEADVINVRSSADGGSGILMQISPVGTVVDVLAETEGADGDEWYMIRYMGMEGFVHEDLLKIVEEVTAEPAATETPEVTESGNATEAPAATDEPVAEETPVPTEAPVIAYAKTLGNVINVRSLADAAGELVMQISPMGTTVDVLAETTGADGMKWYLIRFDGKEGFIRSDLLEIVPDETDEPEATDEPAVTDAPEATDEPVVTDAPEATDEPVVTDAPEATDEPAVTDAPEATDEPAATDAPEATDEPTATDAPEATDEPVVTDEPTETPEPTENPNTYVDQNSDVEQIKAVQLILIQQRWLEPAGSDGEPSGVYDLETQMAVSNLQMWFTNLHDGLIEGMEWDELLYGAPEDYLPEVIDGSRIDAHTLKLIMELRIPVNPLVSE